MKFHTDTKITHTLDIEIEGATFNLDIPVAGAEYIDAFYDNDSNTVRYAAHDDSFRDYEMPEGVILATRASGQSVSDIDRLVEDFEDGSLGEGALFPVGVHQHGNISFSLHGDKRYPDMKWDYAVSGMIFVSSDFIDPYGAATAILEEYTDWANGNCYMLIEVPVNDPDGYDIIGGFIGDKNIQEVVKNGY